MILFFYVRTRKDKIGSLENFLIMKYGESENMRALQSTSREIDMLLRFPFFVVVAYFAPQSVPYTTLFV